MVLSFCAIFVAFVVELRDPCYGCTSLNAVAATPVLRLAGLDEDTSGMPYECLELIVPK